MKPVAVEPRHLLSVATSSAQVSSFHIFSVNSANQNLAQMKQRRSRSFLERFWMRGGELLLNRLPVISAAPPTALDAKRTTSPTSNTQLTLPPATETIVCLDLPLPPLASPIVVPITGNIRLPKHSVADHAFYGFSWRVLRQHFGYYMLTCQTLFFQDFSPPNIPILFKRSVWLRIP